DHSVRAHPLELPVKDADHAHAAPGGIGRDRGRTGPLVADVEEIAAAPAELGRDGVDFGEIRVVTVHEPAPRDAFAHVYRHGERPVRAHDRTDKLAHRGPSLLYQHNAVTRAGYDERNFTHLIHDPFFIGTGHAREWVEQLTDRVVPSVSGRIVRELGRFV